MKKFVLSVAMLLSLNSFARSPSGFEAGKYFFHCYDLSMEDFRIQVNPEKRTIQILDPMDSGPLPFIRDVADFEYKFNSETGSHSIRVSSQEFGPYDTSIGKFTYLVSKGLFSGGESVSEILGITLPGSRSFGKFTGGYLFLQHGSDHGPGEMSECALNK